VPPSAPRPRPAGRGPRLPVPATCKRPYVTELDHVVVLAGGLSPEREVSLRSGRRVRDALEEAGVDARMADADAGLIPALLADPPSAVFPPSNGSYGEDGAIREILALLGTPYVGSWPVPAGARSTSPPPRRWSARPASPRPSRSRCPGRSSMIWGPPRSSTASAPGSACRCSSSRPGAVPRWGQPCALGSRAAHCDRQLLRLRRHGIDRAVHRGHGDRRQRRRPG